ncbi:MAG: efflux RND transporter periplasmic adaptor subunit [Bacteroidetes bacterium]|nr:efflux RND transporter periplasmic adaptor subunit [Bacteroidota bacterium]
MKKILFAAVTISILLIACKDSDSESLSKDNRVRTLDSLKKEMSGLQVKIASLEEEITKDDTSKSEKIKTVELQIVSAQTFNNYVDVQGRVDAEENVSITAEMPGTISRVIAKVGDAVTIGEVLAELDSKSIQQGLAELQNGLELARTLFEKQKNLWDQKIGTEMQYLQAKNQKESLEKRIASVQEQLRMTKIISPINGIVDAVDIKVGQAAAPGVPAIRVVNMNNLKVKAEVAESYGAKVKTGNDVVIIVPDMKDTVKTKIAYSAKVISPLNRTFTVTVNLDNNKEYHPNQIAVLKIIDYSNPKALIVPVGTIQHAGEGDFIFIAEGTKVKKIKVKVGKMYNGRAEITEGLKEGDQLIVKGYQELNEGEIIKY